MLKNNARHRIWIVFALLFMIPMFLFLDAKSDSEESKYNYYRDVKQTVNTIKNEITDAKLPLADYNAIRNDILAMLADNNEDLRDNTINMTDLGGAISGLGLNILDKMDGAHLKKQLDGVNNSIEEYIREEIDKKIFQRKGDQATNTMMGFNEAFAELETAYGALDKEHTLDANKALFGPLSATSAKANLSQTSLHVSVPDPQTVFVTKCPNPSGECYGYYPNPSEHKSLCMYKHGTSGETNTEYWTCFGGTCSRSGEHWLPCGGGCGEDFPPKVIGQRGPVRINGVLQFIYKYASDSPHLVTCNEPVHSWWNPSATCGREYYTCQGPCSHGAEEGIFPRETSGTVTFTHAARLVTAKPYLSVYWYLRKPSDTSGGLGTSVSSVTGDGSSKESSFSRTFTESDEDGTYNVTAYVSFDDSVKQYSYLLTVYKNSGSGSGSNNGNSTNGNISNNNINGNGNGNGNGNTSTICSRDGCDATVTASNAADHAYETCDECDVGYYKCDADAVYAHAWVACRRATCPRKKGTGSNNLFWRRRCQGNPSSCDGGLPHILR